jgi:L-alanine-DL-glutamate epimerase-like enolase superfamily enzyme
MSESRTIVDVDVALYRVPLPDALGDARHGLHTHFELPVVRVTLADGSVGVGYTYTGGKGGRAICSVIAHELAPFLLGKNASGVEGLWEQMQWHVHYVGRGGITGFAISAVDIALWDLRARKADEPLWRLLGGTSNSTRAYAGAVDLNFPRDKLLRNVASYIEAGFDAVKIKLGQPTLREDLVRIEAVRRLIGPEVTFMVDANMGWTPDQAIRAARQMTPYDILWLEEPTLPEDYAAHARIAQEGGIAVAAGENLHTVTEFRDVLAIGHLDFPQPDASNVGGITGWLKVAQLAYAHNRPVCTHGMQELHVSLMAAMPHARFMEMHSFGIDRWTSRPLVVRDGCVTAPDTPGIGVAFDWDRLAAHRVAV